MQSSEFCQRIRGARRLRLLLDEFFVSRRRLVRMARLYLNRGDLLVGIGSALAGGILGNEFAERLAHVVVFLVGEINVRAQEIRVRRGGHVREARRNVRECRERLILRARARKRLRQGHKRIGEQLALRVLGLKRL